MSGSPRRMAALVAGVLLLSGCGFRGAYSITLPGGADLGDRPYTVQIEFADVLDLVPQSAVRVADVPVGRVSEISLADDWTAVVTVEVNGNVELPANAVAAIQQTSLLGEKFVELAPPEAEKPQGRLEDGALIDLDRTSRNVEVEELLGALSMVLNGGGLEKLQTINRELGQALEGRESDIRATLRELDTFVGGLDQQKEEINRALESVNALSASLAARTATIETALDTIGPGLDVFNEQRDLLVSMLESLARLGDVGTRIIEQSAANTVADLQLLQPILTQLAAAGSDLAGSLELLVTYPFPDGSLEALHYRQDTRTGGYGLFTNMTATMEFDLSQLLCRYAIDPVSGALTEGDPLAPEAAECGQPGNVGEGGGSESSSAQSTQSLLPFDVGGPLVEQDPTGRAGGLLGVPGVLGEGGQP
jgi:phospholipid/cholesterol/gamma-HCH transport system substrate-binding protein